MTFSEFSVIADINSKTEIGKVKLIAFYLLSIQGQKEFTVSDINSILGEHHLPQPNISRLKENIRKSSYFLKGKNPSYFKLHNKYIQELNVEFPDIDKSEVIIFGDSILPKILFAPVKRRYIVKLCEQINASYEYNIFDGCAVLMRRLIELLLIHCFEKEQRINEIKDGDGFKSLTAIINLTKTTQYFSLSKITLECLHDFRELGNFSAHQIHYSCTRSEIDTEKKKFRIAVENLLYSSGLL